MGVAKRFIVYGVVGVFVTAMKLLSLYLLRDIAHVEEYVSVVISYVVAVLIHYAANKHITFSVRDPRVMNVMTLKYLASLLLAFSIYMANLFVLNTVVGAPFYMAVVVALGISYIVNFLLYEKLVFLTGTR